LFDIDAAHKLLTFREKDTMPKHGAVLPTTAVPVARARFSAIWSAALVASGLGLTFAWMCFLGYGFVKAIEVAF